MNVFLFIIILALIITLGEVASKVLGPLASQLGDLLGEMAKDRRLRREGRIPAEALPPSEVEHLESRLARIEDRLDFIEALRAPEARPPLRGRDEPPS